MQIRLLLRLKAFLLLTAIFMLIAVEGYSQRYLSDYDSTFFVNDTLRPFLKRMENLHFSGYIQPQYQVAQAKGIDSYAGGNFADLADNRFMLRRARVKIDYKMPGRNGSFPAALFTFQFEATERDVNVRDMFVRIYEPSRSNFSLTAGLFARPFGFEVNLSSSFRETPERGRMSQILMPSERDLGAMVSYESQRPGRKNPQLKFDIGFFNGQGKSGPAEFDSYKDLISRLSLKPMPLSRRVSLSGGLSFLHGGWAQATRYRYETGIKGNEKLFIVDSSLSNIGDKAPRHYYGADVQLIYKHAWGKTELRGEYWKGTQPGTAATTVNPGVLPMEPTYIRDFDGGFFYFIQNLVNEKWEFVAKYDWYDPNTEVSTREIGRAGSNFSQTDIRINTLGAGLTYYFTDNLKLLVYYDRVMNEKTSLPSFSDDIKDDVFTCRIQMRF
ncbi:MAG TPA: porin [Flavisolibacter sp.]|nr:porin [Flavisolibacter sp.]